jgi:hypothetical protein
MSWFFDRPFAPGESSTAHPTVASTGSAPISGPGWR